MVDCATEMGWGSGWGSGPWGGASSGDLRLLGGIALRDNLIRLELSEPPVFTGVLDAKDASDPVHYAISPDATTTGYDGFPPRDVAIVQCELALFDGAGGRFLDLTLDRPMSPYPCKYLVSINNLWSASTGLPYNPCFASVLILALFRRLQPQVTDQAVPSRDIANPMTLTALLDPLPLINANQLGIIPIDDLGDYGFDEGISNLRKRVYRRLITRKGAFTFLPFYGVGIPAYLKKLSLASVRSELAAEAQSQISQEPDVEKCSVQIIPDANAPNLIRVIVKVKVKGTGNGFQFDFPFPLNPLPPSHDNPGYHA